MFECNWLLFRGFFGVIVGLIISVYVVVGDIVGDVYELMFGGCFSVVCDVVV